jgi:uncharacterized protein YbcI
MNKSESTVAEQIAGAASASAMEKTNSTVAEQIARAASAFEERLTGHAPQSVTVVLSGETLVITLHGALSAAERVLAQNPAGAAQVQEFHRQLFNSSADELRQEIKRITGVDVRELAAEVEPTTGTVVKAFTSGTVVQVFLLAGHLPTATWNGTSQSSTFTMSDAEMAPDGRDGVVMRRSS